MKLSGFISLLHSKLSEDSKILTDRQDTEFKSSLERWSNFELKVPGAIIKPANEADAVLTVSLITTWKYFAAFKSRQDQMSNVMLDNRSQRH